MKYSIYFRDENGNEQISIADMDYDSCVKQMAFCHKELTLLDAVRYQACAERGPLETIRFTRDNKGICSYYVRPSLKR